MRFKLWIIFVLTQVVGACGAPYYSPHGSYALALYFTVVLLFPGVILALWLRDLLSGVDFGYATILIITIPVNFVVWYCCAHLVGKIRRGSSKGPAKPTDARYSRFFAVTAALVLTFVGSVTLFVAIQSFSPYVALLKGQFYTPVLNSTETFFDRAFGRTGLALLRLALWPSVVFLALQAGATYAISTLLPFDGRFVVIRRLIAGAGVSVLMSAVVLAAMWSMLVGSNSH